MATDLKAMGLPMELDEIVSVLVEASIWANKTRPEPKETPVITRPEQYVIRQIWNGYFWKDEITGLYYYPDAETFLDPAEVNYSCSYDDTYRYQKINRLLRGR